VALSAGELFVPEGYQAPDGQVHLVLHLHGSAEASEQNLLRWGGSAVLVTVVLPGLSRVYTDLLSKPDTFPTILAETVEQLRALGIAEDPTIAHLTVTSFSAGFGGVRELLKSDEIYEQIDTLVMADSIHAGFAGDPQRRQVNSDHMQGFLRFARDAAEGRKTMVISHSQIKPETYASTTETADYLLGQTEVEREPADEEWAEGLHLLSRAEKGRLVILGFGGDTGPDHMRHLWNLWRFMKVADGDGSEPAQGENP